ncbi:MAG TPA: peptide deformylase [Acidimicrobiia bacterium]|jgi:peptide deformylase|nr:peptide deformylase [Acidimicrobiia bacterium]
MATYPIRLFGDPVLKQQSREVAELDGELAGLIDAMYETMYENLGVGLAAAQIGVLKRLFTYDVGDGPTAVINPEIVEAEGEVVFDEGCLSIPELRFEILRPQKITLRGVDLHGHEIVVEDDEFLARAIQHEMDHLNGVLLLDRLDPADRKRALRALRNRDLVASVPVPGGAPRL